MEYVASKLVHLDEEHLSLSSLHVSASDGEAKAAAIGGDDEQEQRRKRGGSRQTKNVGLMVALHDKMAGEGGEAGGRKGLIVATTHL